MSMLREEPRLVLSAALMACAVLCFLFTLVLFFFGHLALPLAYSLPASALALLASLLVMPSL
jgi:hypothetical protein